MNEILIPNIRSYAERHRLELAEKLGSGKDGIVLAAKGKARPASVAVKALRWAEFYQREKQVYCRLKELRVTTALGFNVPQLLGYDDDLLVIEMTIVKAPFVLDFAGTYLDMRPHFSDDVWADWEAEKREQFETKWPIVKDVIGTFETYGIYLMDVSPGNIGFGQ